MCSGRNESTFGQDVFVFILTHVLVISTLRSVDSVSEEQSCSRTDCVNCREFLLDAVLAPMPHGIMPDIWGVRQHPDPGLGIRHLCHSNTDFASHISFRFSVSSNTSRLLHYRTSQLKAVSADKVG
ncbi:hypothetical protein VFPPC_17745 [Pochonia chlamydosporia 170]|uniref:Secreted protein n=1 Tax=Pochonia chlamydosporia 170 TaxID=1380566 RepID=A0A219AR43_METCM|nr:hypothetical protein VFPPC_17745 [Pochonia chlamydosporia 170]OWT43079.1 hypothetical protein VFPPC_17745 [Pochonia chlamydosporia 170]